MGKFLDAGAALHALETAAPHANTAGQEVSDLWNGSSWTSPGGERRDLPAIRPGMGEWLISPVEPWH
nr:hypothetical protein GCM10010200_034340 [Actinomadura rugatobispora]